MQTCLLARYRGRDPGVPDTLLFVGVTVAHGSITLDQRADDGRIDIEEIGSTHVRKTCAPLDPGADLSERKMGERDLDTSQFPYARIPGKLMFLARRTGSDLVNIARELGRRAASPCLRHWRGLQHVLRFLAGTLDVCLRYGIGIVKIDKSLMGYADSDWANGLETRRGVTGYLPLMSKSPTVWRSTVQASVPLPISEAE